MGEPRGDLFGAPAVQAPVVLPAPIPVAAPVHAPAPYKVAGRVMHGGTPRVFLTHGERVFEVEPGADLEAGYRLESIGADHVVLLHVARGTRESLPFEPMLEAIAPPKLVALPPTPIVQAAPTAAPTLPATSSQDVPSKTEPAQLRWAGPERVRAGDRFSVALHISTGRPLLAAPMQVRYEPDLLEPVEVRAGRFFGQGSFAWRSNAGAIFIGASGRGVPPGADAELVVLTFRPKRAGITAQVTVSSLDLQAPGGGTLPHADLSPYKAAIQ